MIDDQACEKGCGVMNAGEQHSISEMTEDAAAHYAKEKGWSAVVAETQRPLRFVSGT